MTANWRVERLPKLVQAIAARPRHEALRGHITELLHAGFNAPHEDIAHEVYLLDGSGRIDTMWGATVIELKSDLRKELGDVLARMPAYLADAAKSRRRCLVAGLRPTLSGRMRWWHGAICCCPNGRLCCQSHRPSCIR